MPISLSELSDLLQGTLIGEGSISIAGIAEIASAESGQITFIASKKYEAMLAESKASAVIISYEMDSLQIPAILVSDTQLAKAKTLQYFNPGEDVEPHIDEKAIIDENVAIGDGSYVGAGAVIKGDAVLGNKCKIMENVVIGSEVTLGDECVINPGVVLSYKVTIGNRVEIGSGTVIGGEGFGYLQDGNSIMKVPQVGSVVIEDDVSIGANCCIDRGTMGTTLIRKGAKLDNLVHISHNVEIGENTIIAALGGIAGSTTIGSGVLMGGQVGIIGHIQIGDGVKIAGKSGVMKSFSDGVAISGIPARIHKESLSKDANISRVPKLSERIKELEQEVDKLKNRFKENE